MLTCEWDEKDKQTSVVLVLYTACKAKAFVADVYLSLHSKRFNNDSSHTQDEVRTRTACVGDELSLHFLFFI